MEDILINKSATIDKCIKRVREDYQDDFRTNYTRQDAAILNIERACQAALDMATHVIRIHKLGVPQSHRDAFDKLEKAKIIDPKLSSKLKAMAGFRNIAVHDYSSMNIEVVINIIEKNLKDLQQFARILLKM